MKPFLFIFIVFLLNTIYIFSEDYEGDEILTLPTITEALNYTGNKDIVKKLVITGTIAGTDYSEGSEWREFRTLDTTFPNIEAVEIWTEQDIPDNQLVEINHNVGLFFHSFMEYDENGVPIVYGSNWLKEFSAPNVMSVGRASFWFCKNLLFVDFAQSKWLGSGSLSGCYSLIEVYLPKVESMGNTCFLWSFNLRSIFIPSLESTDWGIFLDCSNLESVNIGTNFSQDKEVVLGHAVFGDSILFPSGSVYGEPVKTSNIELTLGEYVLPKHNTILNAWQGTNSGYDDYEYVWKSIEIISDIKEEQTENTDFLNIDKNHYLINNENISDIHLFDILGRYVRSVNTEPVIILNDLPPGVYFFRYKIKNDPRFFKIVIY